LNHVETIVVGEFANPSRETGAVEDALNDRIALQHPRRYSDESRKHGSVDHLNFDAFAEMANFRDMAPL
jgi:hypothetical protein